MKSLSEMSINEAILSQFMSNEIEDFVIFFAQGPEKKKCRETVKPVDMLCDLSQFNHTGLLLL